MRQVTTGKNSPGMRVGGWLGAGLALALLSACDGSGNRLSGAAPAQDAPPPDVLPAKFRHATGDVEAGRPVFRFETFGNEGFWTDAMQLPQGIAAAGITPLQALQVGLSVNFDALSPATQQALAEALAEVQESGDPAGTAFTDPAVTLALINQNAVIGVVAFDAEGNRKPLGSDADFDPDDALDLGRGDKVGLSCAGCHAITDGSVIPEGAFGVAGSVGSVIDGPTPNNLDVGTILSLAANTLAYYPMLQLQFDVLDGATIGRGSFPGLVANEDSLPTEAEADTYLTGSDAQGRFYPVGTFDAFPDGIGNPLHIAPFFRTDLSAPWGIDGGVELLENFNNTVYTVSLDPTGLLTDGGRAFLNAIAGPVGDEIAADYERVLRATGVIAPDQAVSDVVPFVTSQPGLPPGSQQATIGRRVDDTALLDLNAYLDSLPAPAAVPHDAVAAARGRELFRTSTEAGGAGCTGCHQVDPNRFVPPNVIAMSDIYPGYDPTLIFDRAEPLSDIQDSGGPSPFFDDRMIVLDASRGGRGEVRGAALPLLLDLGRKTTLLHDQSVRGASFDEAAGQLLDPARGSDAAHPFFVADPAQRSDVVEFLKSLETGN